MTRIALLISIALLSVVSVQASAQAQGVEHQVSSPEAQALLRDLVDDPMRPEQHKARDKYRHPFEALSFFGLEPGMVVVEIWPGGQGRFMGRIVQPLVEGGGGWYVPVSSKSPFPLEHPDVPYGEADMVLVFRAHAFMIYPHDEQKYINEIYRMLKPGGIFGIVDHSGDENVPQDMAGVNGYVNESYMLMLARRAGFRLLAVSDVNHNPKDTHDHPNGMWSLPPALRNSEDDPEARAKFRAIGESDRFTHKYYKPLTAGVEPQE